MEKLVTELCEAGVNARESEGNPRKAYELFQKAYNLAVDDLNKAGIRCEMALCLQHMKEYSRAKVLYSFALTTYLLNNDILSMARIDRQVSAIYLAEGYTKEAMDLALKARQALIDSKIIAVDRPHFTHGILKVLYAKRKNSGVKSYLRYTKEITSWIKVEFGEIQSMLKGKKTLQTNVYLTGFLADVFYVFPPLTWPAGALGYLVAKENKLGMRLKQSPFGK